MVITGLFRIQGDGETTFTTWENADIEPVQVDVICCILNFRHMAIFGEIGSRYMPIALILDGEAQFSELYTTYKWESAPTILGERIPRDALMKWDAMSPQEKYKIYKQWTAK